MKVSLKNIVDAEKKLKKCPFCGASVEIGICDAEGNFQGLSYLDDPYSGTSFIITHAANKECLLHCDPGNWSHVGQFLYDTLDELVSIWNYRY